MAYLSNNLIKFKGISWRFCGKWYYKVCISAKTHLLAFNQLLHWLDPHKPKSPWYIQASSLVCVIWPTGETSCSYSGSWSCPMENKPTTHYSCMDVFVYNWRSICTNIMVNYVAQLPTATPICAHTNTHTHTWRFPTLINIFLYVSRFYISFFPLKTLIFSLQSLRSTNRKIKTTNANANWIMRKLIFTNDKNNKKNNAYQR